MDLFCVLVKITRVVQQNATSELKTMYWRVVFVVVASFVYFGFIE
jgi:hypothetical protein